MNFAVRLITGIPRDASVTNALRELYWLPFVTRVRFKLALPVYNGLRGNAPHVHHGLATGVSIGQNAKIAGPQTAQKSYSVRKNCV